MDFQIIYSEKIVHAGSSIHKVHREFSTVLNSTKMLHSATIVFGNARRRSIIYYAEESFCILYSLENIIKNIAITGKKLNIRDIETIIELKKAFIIPNELLDRIDKYSMFSSMIMTRK